MKLDPSDTLGKSGFLRGFMQVIGDFLAVQVDAVGR